MPLQDRDRRALMFLAAAVAFYFVLEFGFAPSSSSGSGVSFAGGSLSALEERLKTAQVRAGQKPLTDAELEAATAELKVREERLLTSADASLAQAEMQSLTEELLSGEGVTMASSRFSTVQLEQDAYAQVPLTVDFDCRIEQFVNLMAAISNSPRLLTTRGLRIQPRNDDVKTIRVQMTLAGYLPVEKTPELVKKTTARTLGGSR